MSELERLNDHQLQKFASLLVTRDEMVAACENGETGYLNQHIDLEQLDYHGITMLALHAGRLPTRLADQACKRKVMLVASEVLKQEALITLFDGFKAAGLSHCVLFKGGALAYSHYPEPWLRPRSDSDCLIDQRDYKAYSGVLESLGYQKQFAIAGRYVSYQSTFTKNLTAKSSMNIDLHWRINNRQCLAKAFTVQELMKDGHISTRSTTEIHTPCAVDNLLIASLHRLGHHPYDERLIWLYDIHLLAENLSNEEWLSLLSKARQKKIAAITLDALRCCEQLFGTNIPYHANLELAAGGAEPSQIFLQRNLPEWRYFLNDLRSLDGLAAKFGLIKESVFPDPEYIRQQMKTRSVVLGYVKRFVRGIKRVSGVR